MSRSVLFVIVIGLAVAITSAAYLRAGTSPDYTRQCESQGGTVVSIGGKSSCVLDGAVVGEWLN